MKIVSSDDDMQVALQFLQTALVCDPRNAVVRAPPPPPAAPAAPAIHAARSWLANVLCSVFIVLFCRSKLTSTLSSASKKRAQTRRCFWRSRFVTS